ncbi:ArnT family glycosyltransferase [Sediminibacterium ginsengisoli]|uniref:4-amino-4-deoxy-L-arabinose transferase n=1 Tax=Sediminibacterium ginsengisoli TaxID=413434 RepID=A0A1T4QUH3_9BACT|nr:glycosyltransferase family 39 protein [Sediminibacterium ginsengisoli]SKA07355.1 4-amino-4-deoxy-L-arabinose transferase [Sediminibacterium ginsengisoli]
MITNRTMLLVLASCLLAWLLGMIFIPVMDIDAAQYASISREMLDNVSFLQVYDLGKDYLDKPPMLFWLSAISMKIFGVHDWAYRIPSMLFAMLAVYSTYRLALLFYNKTIAQLSALVLASSQAMFLLMHDVRCDTMLMGWVAFSLWQMAEWYENRKWTHFLGAFAAIAGGMMTKGPIALMVPVFAFVPHFALRREWKQYFRWEYIPGLLLIALLLVPMSIGLYQQYDLHPGKIVNGVPIQSGLRFYYWTQSFGRYTGENQYHEMSYFTFLLENMLWSFIPWIILFLAGLVFACRDIIRKRFRLGKTEECITTGGFILTYCVLARSQAQLPHYIFVVFPLASVITARFLHSLLFTENLKEWKKPVLVIHAVIFVLLWCALIVLMTFVFKNIPRVIAAAAAAGLLALLYMLFRNRNGGLPLLLKTAFFTVAGINIFLNSFFYPNLLKYQLGNTAAAVLQEQKIDPAKLVQYKIMESRALHFYAQHIIRRKETADQLRPDEVVLTEKDSLSTLQQQFPAMKTIFEGEYFGITMLTLPFLNPATREKEVTRYVIADLDGKP